MSTRSRRRLLSFLTASPVIAAVPSALDAMLWTGEGQFSTYKGGGDRTPDGLLGSPEDAIDVFDFRAVAEANLPPAHYGYMATGVDGDVTLRTNREGMGKFCVRPRRLVDVESVDLSVEFFGTH